ncbi:MAG: hypothetical protein H6708_21900 [Kofleriaceae bacterium]|nr:hypothetical protein [Myxococcales bacterium]MCB9563069.1 hypothetical protein [Kofleriaceae bacterium]
MRKPAILAAVFVALAAAGAIVLMVRPARTQQSTTTLTVGIYAPSVEFANAQARLQYVQGLAKAIESATGVKTSAQAFASLSALRKGGVDYAIVDGQCYATNQSWKLVANANIGGGTTRNWALYSSVGSDMKSLEGKKLAFVQTGCNDNGFIDNAMLESEVSSGFFAGRVGKPDITAAVAEVVSYKGAQAVFAPVGSQKGLTKVFDTGAVPNPAFVQLNTKVPSATASKVESAVTGFGGGGAISSWSSASKSPYSSLAGRMGKSVKKGVFAAPDPVRFDAKDVLIEPTTLDDTAVTDVKQHFERPPVRME